MLTPLRMEESITYCFLFSILCCSVSCFCLHTVIQTIPRNTNATLPFRSIHVKCECVEMFSSANPPILWEKTMRKVPNSRLSYALEKNQWIIKL